MLDLQRPFVVEGRADGLLRGVCRLLDGMGLGVLPEMSLGNGRRPDVVGLDGKGRVTIVEIKSGLADYRADRKWPEYLPWCDAFYFAVAVDFPREALPSDVGLIVADRYAADIVRRAPAQAMAAHRRRKLTLRFARIGAARLRGHYGEPGAETA